MRALLWTTILALSLALPTASASTLEEQIEDFHFERLFFTITWNSETDRANVVVDAADLVFRDEAARDLRLCIDNDDDCPVQQLRAAAVESDNDGDVTGDEVESFALYLKTGLSTTEQVRDVLRNLKSLVKIDDQAATSITFSDLRLDGAQGSTSDTDDIHFTATITGSYGTVKPAETHKVSMQRGEANITLADTVIVQTGKGWKIDGDSIQPSYMQDYLEKGKISGTQDEFESRDPLNFTISKSKSSPGWGAFGAMGALLVATLRRRKL